jgi:hypothetical protein
MSSRFRARFSRRIMLCPFSLPSSPRGAGAGPGACLRNCTGDHLVLRGAFRQPAHRRFSTPGRAFREASACGRLSVSELLAPARSGRGRSPRSHPGRSAGAPRRRAPTPPPWPDTDPGHGPRMGGNFLNINLGLLACQEARPTNNVIPGEARNARRGPGSSARLHLQDAEIRSCDGGRKTLSRRRDPTE